MYVHKSCLFYSTNNIMLTNHEHGSMSTEYNHDKVVTSSNSAYGVVSSEDHEYDVIGLQETHTQNISTTGHPHL